MKRNRNYTQKQNLFSKNRSKKCKKNKENKALLGKKNKNKNKNKNKMIEFGEIVFQLLFLQGLVLIKLIKNIICQFFPSFNAGKMWE